MNIVFIPGFMTDEELWDAMIDDMSFLGDVITCRLSEKTELIDLAKDIINSSPSRFVVVGFSLGGYIARWIAYLVPERIEAMILISTSNRQDDKSQITKKRLNKHKDDTNKYSYCRVSSKTISSALHEKNITNTRLSNIINAMWLRLGPKSYITQSNIVRINPPVKKNSYPVLIIASSGDKIRTIQESEDLLKEYSHASLEIIDDAGHLIPIEQPKKLVKIIKNWISTIK